VAFQRHQNDDYAKQRLALQNDRNIMNMQKVLHYYLHGKSDTNPTNHSFLLLVLFYTNTSFPCNLVVEDTPETSGWLVRHENTNPPRLTTHPELAHPDIQSLAPVSS
jgi:hypothetical protein